MTSRRSTELSRGSPSPPAEPRTLVHMTAAADGRSMRDRMLAGELYLADDPELQEAGLRAMDLMDAFNATSAREPEERHRLLTELLGAIGDDTDVRPPIRIDYGSHIRIGARTFVNYGLVALDV